MGQVTSSVAHRRPSRGPWVIVLLAVASVSAVPALLDGRPVTGPAVSALVQLVVSAPLAYSIPEVLPVAKAALLLAAAVAVVGTRHSPRMLVAYYAATLVVVGVFQNAADLGERGLAFLTGNAVAQVALAAGCLVSLRSVTGPAALRRARLWVLPLMLLALAFPYAEAGTAVRPGWDGALTNGSGVSYCMVTAVVAGAMFVRPEAYPALLRVAVGALGAIFGLMNLVTWFVIAPQSWWMGVLHVPLLVCSLDLTMTAWQSARSAGR